MSHSSEQLRQIIDRLERQQECVDEEKEALRDIFADAKAHGFDVPVLRIILKRRRMDRSDLEEQEMILETYESAINGEFDREPTDE
jgi:uncharacterized protein (UPF0335 family)